MLKGVVAERVTAWIGGNPPLLHRESYTKLKERDKAMEVVKAFDRAVGRVPWEPSLLSPRSEDNPLRIALLAKVSEAEATEWRDYAKRWWRRYAQQMVEA